MNPVIQTLSLILIALTLVSLAWSTVGVRRREGRSSAAPLRPIEAITVIPQMIGFSVESDRPLLLSTGGAPLGGEHTLIALAGAELASYLARETAVGQSIPVFLTSEVSTLPLGYDALQRAYNLRDLPNRSGFTHARWYPAGSRSLVFAAMLTATLHSDQIGGGVLVGSFGAELGLVLASCIRRGIPVIAGTDDLAGTAIVYAMSDGALLGENVFAVTGYLGDRPNQRASLFAMNFLRVTVILALLLITLQQPDVTDFARSVVDSLFR